VACCSVVQCRAAAGAAAAAGFRDRLQCWLCCVKEGIGLRLQRGLEMVA
jgi:hypothetical protein